MWCLFLPCAGTHGGQARGILQPFAGFSGLTGAAKPAAEKTSVSTSGSTATATATSGSYQQAMEALNKSFLAFVNGQSQRNPSASWVAAVQVCSCCWSVYVQLRREWELMSGVCNFCRIT